MTEGFAFGLATRCMSPALDITIQLEPARAFLAGQTLPTWCDPSRLVLCLLLDEASPSNNTIKGLHFHAYKKLRVSMAAKVKQALGSTEAPQLPQSALYIVRRSAGSLDWDNAIGGLKPILDCLVRPSDRNPNGLHIIEDDKPRNMPFPPMMKQLPAKKGQGSTEIYVFAVDAE